MMKRGAYRAMLKIFREAKIEMEKEKYIPKPKHDCLRCGDQREIWVWKDTTETEKIRVDCPMCSVQRPIARTKKSWDYLICIFGNRFCSFYFSAMYN